MTEIEFVKWAILALLSGGGFLMKRTLDRIQSDQENSKNDIQRIRDEYLHKNDFKDFKLELRSMFEEIRTDIRRLQK